jgi:SAM-dependent methyltransferase
MGQTMPNPEWTYWNGEAGERWVAEQEALDRALEPFGQAVLARAPALAGARVIDVGCGCGATTVALADKVGPSGHVLGVDISGAMLDRARARTSALANVEFAQGDAQSWTFPPGADLVFSRFGVMFFQDPIAAFRNLAGALRPGGRAAFVCWRAFEDNPWVHVPFVAAEAVVPTRLTTAAPDAPGPFAFADRNRVETILAAAGLVEIAIEGFDHDVMTGADVERSTDLAMKSGPTGRLLADASESTRALAREAILAAMKRHERGGGVTLAGRAWIVTASGHRPSSITMSDPIIPASA